MIRLFQASLLLLFGAATIFASDRATRPFTHTTGLAPLPAATSAQDRLPSNSIIDMEFFSPALFIATGGGLSRFIPLPGGAADEGSFRIARGSDGFGPGGVSGLAVGINSAGDTLLFAATARDTTIGGETYGSGGGVGLSLDLGESWLWWPQPVDSRDTTGFPRGYSPTVTSVQNITYDIGILGDKAWIASWGGGLRYLDMTLPEPVWVNQPPDTLPFNVLDRLNHRAFSIAVMDTLLFVGTAKGVNLSRDNGLTWQNYSHTPGSETSLSGNFIPALGAQITTSGRQILWAAAWSAEASTEFYSICKSEDYGLTWSRVYGSVDDPVRTHNFAFEDSVVYAATDHGLLKSSDYGQTWGVFPPVRDSVTGERVYEVDMFSAAAGAGRLFAGGPEGLGISDDGGLSWRLLRSFPTPGSAGQPTAYAYPNPFSPDRFAVVRFQYRLNRAGPVTLELYDFALELLIRPVKNANRGVGDHAEVWDGRGPGGSKIANGAYFFRLQTPDGEHWGKLLVLD